MWTLLMSVLLVQDPAELARDRGLNLPSPRDVEPPGLWYGTPGLRANDNLLDVLFEPRRLLEWSPRKRPGGLDPDVERFNRIYEERRRAVEEPR